MATKYFVIDKLNRQNFAKWEKDMKYVLVDRYCYNLVIQKENKAIQVDIEKAPSAAVQDWELQE